MGGRPLSDTRTDALSFPERTAYIFTLVAKGRMVTVKPPIRYRGLLAGIVSLALLVGSIPLHVGAEKLADRIGYTDDGEIADLLLDTHYYETYLEEHANWEGKGSEEAIILPLHTFTAEGDAPILGPAEGKEETLLWEEGCRSLSAEVQVPEDGLYQLWITYFAVDGNSLDITRGIQIDGEAPFDEAENIAFPRFWRDASPPAVNGLGDEVRSSQVEIKKWTDAPVTDNQGMVVEPLLFALSAGTHRLTLVYLDQPLLISGVRFQKPKAIPTYAQVSEAYRDKGFTEAAEELRFEAEAYENLIYKTSSSIVSNCDTNATMVPRSLTSRKFNYMGGTNWATGGAAVTWTFHVPQTGLYKLVFRLTQNGNSGMPSVRQIAIDGEVPFAEMNAYSIPYTAGWTTHVVKADDGTPYAFYLEEGDHTLTLTAKIGDMAELVHLVEEANGRLSNCYQNIVMVTGQSPDLNYDYELDKAIPSLKDALQTVIDVLDTGIRRLSELTNGTASLENSMRQVRDTIAQYRDNPDRIPSGLSDFSGALTNMGDWMNTLKYPTLALDCIRFVPPSAEVINEKQSFWDALVTTAVSVWQSFVKDYNAVGNSAASGESRTLEVWVARGKEWAELLKELSDREFAIDRQVEVRMNLLPEGALSGTVNTLLLAINAGREPDVVLGLPSANAMEYAVRGAIRELSSLDGFAEVRERHPAELYTPLTYEDKVYALPETMDFKVLFYRTDVFEKLHLQVPDTWDDVYKTLLPRLYQYHLQMYLPVSYELFLYQHGGQYYNEDKTKSALDSQAGYDAFEQFIANYKDYGIPYSASLYNRFRTGEMPIGIAGMTEYMQIAYASPELVGKWSIAPIPATRDGDTLNRSVGPVLQTTSVILATSDEPELAFEYLNWWSSAETQTEYGKRLESLLGMSARWATANTEAFRALPWPTAHMRVIEESWQWIREAPYVVGGYFTARHVNNAISRCVAGNYTPRESLEEAIRQINIELERKRRDFKLD